MKVLYSSASLGLPHRSWSLRNTRIQGRIGRFGKNLEAIAKAMEKSLNIKMLQSWGEGELTWTSGAMTRLPLWPQVALSFVCAIANADGFAGTDDITTSSDVGNVDDSHGSDHCVVDR